MAHDASEEIPAEGRHFTPIVAPANPTYSPEFLAEQQAIMTRVREEGARRIRRSCERAVALGIIDKEGDLLKMDLPADMLPGSDRDFGG
jgi:hypothetical protein